MQQIGTKGMLEKAQLSGKGDPLEIVQKIRILTMLTNSVCINQNLFQKMRCIKFSEILRYEWIT